MSDPRDVGATVILSADESSYEGTSTHSYTQCHHRSIPGQTLGCESTVMAHHIRLVRIFNSPTGDVRH